MRLRKMEISRYRSIKGSEVLIVDDRMTILIGANDHGKTNLLSAVQCLNDDYPIKAEDKHWDASDGDHVEIRWFFLANKETLERISPFSSSESGPIQQPQSGSDNDKDAMPLLECFPENGSGEIIFSKSSADNVVKIVSLPMTVPVSNGAKVLALRPRVELFPSPTTNLKDQVNREDLEKPEFEFMQGIFRLADLWESRNFIFQQNDKTSRKLDEASSTLTVTLNDKWNQGKELRWKLEHTGTNGDHIIIKIRDPAIRSSYTRPSLRSSGFRTYFLLSMITFARTQNQTSNSYIYLFDEPGTYLHPYAQLDLQRSFEAIADKTQLIYTTHSLFLVNKNYPERNRVISKSRQGTKIDQKPFTKNWKSVRDSLGILLSNNFLIADKTLLVEGPSDIIYVLDAIKRLKRLGQIDVDLNDFSMVDAGDERNYIALAKLMLSEGRSVVALMDGDSAGKKLKAQLEKICAKEIAAKQLQTHILPDNKSVEDVFCDLSVLKNAVSSSYLDLKNNELRVTKDVDLNIEVERIAANPEKTLGKTLDDLTRSWFDPEEKISKLSIALFYEELRMNGEGGVPDLAISELERIKALLNLRGEKSVNKGVFEELDQQ